MSSELFIMKKIAKDTRGTLYVPLGENHLNEIFNFIAEPVPIFVIHFLICESLLELGLKLRLKRKSILSTKFITLA